MTIKNCLIRAAEESPDSIALRYKQQGQWHTRTYSDLLERVWYVAEMLAFLGVRTGERVAIYHENSPEWYELYLGIVSIGATAVPVDAKLREQELTHIFHDSKVRVVFCSDRYADMVCGLKSRLSALKAVVAIGENGADARIDPEIDLHGYETLRQEVDRQARSKRRAFDRMAPQEESPASFMYTSGTTGRQKAAVLSHGNFMANVEAIVKAIDFQKNDNLLLVLPLHHSFAFTCAMLVPLYIQCQVSLVENLKTIRANMQETHPTILLAVPLLLDKMLARIQEGIDANPFATALCRLGLTKMVGRKVLDGLGGTLRLVISGGAPISPDTLLGWGRLGIPIVEGYGITETAPVLAVNPPGQARVGTVGLPLEGVEVRILESNDQGVGEIAVRGANVMKGYYNNPEETAKVLVDGWYHTGDLGFFDEMDYLVISGRKKNLIVNREGKNIYPQELELQILKSPYLLECLAMGYRESYDEVGERVGVIVVPDLAAIDAMEDRNGKRLSDDEIERFVRDEVRRQVSALATYKHPRCIQVHFEEFEKTTTQKVKRYLYAIHTEHSEVPA